MSYTSTPSSRSRFCSVNVASAALTPASASAAFFAASGPMSVSSCTGVLVSGVLVSGVLVSGVLVSGVLTSAAASDSSDTGALVSPVSIPGVPASAYPCCTLARRESTVPSEALMTYSHSMPLAVNSTS